MLVMFTLFGLQVAIFPHAWAISSSDPRHNSVTPFYLNHLIGGFVPKRSHLQKPRELGRQHRFLMGMGLKFSRIPWKSSSREESTEKRKLHHIPVWPRTCGRPAISRRS